MVDFPANPNFSNSTAPDLSIREKTPHLILIVQKPLEAHSLNMASILRHALKRGLLLELLGMNLAST